MLTKTDDWYTRVMLPWFETDELHVEWQVWRFNKTIFELEPHQGVPRYVTQESEQHSDTIVRRGLVRAAAVSAALCCADNCSGKEN